MALGSVGLLCAALVYLTREGIARWFHNPGLEPYLPILALFVALAEDRRHVIIGIAAAVVVLGLPILAGVGIAIAPSWYLIIASTVAATIGAAVWREE